MISTISSHAIRSRLSRTSIHYCINWYLLQRIILYWQVTRTIWINFVNITRDKILADARIIRKRVLSRIEDRIWSSLVHIIYSNRVVSFCWFDRCFSCKLLNISTHCSFWSSMSLSLVIHEYLNSRAIHNEVFFLSSSWLVLYLQFIVLVNKFSFSSCYLPTLVLDSRAK